METLALRSARTRRASPKAPSPRVLVATTCPHRRHALASVLRKLGYVVHTAPDGFHAALHLGGALLEGNPKLAPDLVICDARMPGVLGTSILSGLRDVGWDKPIFVLTDFNDDVGLQRAAQLGATRVYSKPVDIGVLCRAALDAVPVSSATAKVARRAARQRPGSHATELSPETVVDRGRRVGAI